MKHALALLLLLPLSAQERKPNIVFILADDLGSAELGCTGQKKIRTPRIDRLAAEGTRFMQFYAGNAVCAPSRCTLMTGRHPGHAWVRSNRELPGEGQIAIPAATVTIAELLKGKGYATGAVGKWGLGAPGSEGDPIRQGFDLFFGYNCQRHAHNHYPVYLWKNDRKIELDGKTYSHDLMEKEALGFIRSNKDRPFFLYVPFAIPHLAVQVPEDSLEEYRGKFEEIPYDGKRGYQAHPTPRAGHAAMITRMDRSVGRIVDLLSELGLEKDTLVLFSSDNGGPRGGAGMDGAFFETNGLLRGHKGSLFEGGIRVPLIARWPGRVRAGATNEFVGGFQDLLPTFGELAGAEAPRDADGLSFLPTLFGKGEQRKHEFLYWEFPSGGGWQAVRIGDWKGVLLDLAKKKTEIHLYDLAKDPGESEDVAAKHPDVVERIAKIMAAEHVPSEIFPLPGIDPPAKRK